MIRERNQSYLIFYLYFQKYLKKKVIKNKDKIESTINEVKNINFRAANIEH